MDGRTDEGEKGDVRHKWCYLFNFDAQYTGWSMVEDFFGPGPGPARGREKKLIYPLARGLTSLLGHNHNLNR